MWDVSELLGLDLPPRPAEVLMFDSRRSLRRYIEKESPYHADAAAVCFVTEGAYVVAISRSWRTTETLRYLRHELAHYVLAAHYHKLPPWINEGLAQFFELRGPYGRPHPRHLKTVTRQLRRSEGDILSRLVALPEGVRFDFQDYAQAWGLTHFFLLDPRYGAVAVKDYLAAINSGADAQEQFRKSFGRSPDEMESSWREHLIRLEAGDY